MTMLKLKGTEAVKPISEVPLRGTIISSQKWTSPIFEDLEARLEASQHVIGLEMDVIFYRLGLLIP